MVFRPGTVSSRPRCSAGFPARGFCHFGQDCRNNGGGGRNGRPRIPQRLLRGYWRPASWLEPPPVGAARRRGRSIQTRALMTTATATTSGTTTMRP